MEQNEYDGHWITTFTGLKFHYLDPQADEVNILDIAHALSLLCRFNGHTKMFYSVAEHSLRVAHIVPNFPLAALLHDAHEAYISDIPRPIKADMPIYEKIAERIQRIIENKYGVGKYDKREVKQADHILLATEARDLMDNTKDWLELPTPLNKRIHPMKIEEVEVTFLRTFHSLVRRDYEEIPEMPISTVFGQYTTWTE